MTVVELRERVDLVRKLHQGPSRTLLEFGVFIDVLRSVAHTGINHATARELCLSALTVLDK